MRTALLLIDVQNDYFKQGAMELVEMEKAAQNCQQLLKHFRAKHLSVIHVQHIALHPAATFFLPNTFGCELHNTVMPKENEAVIIKNYPNSFRDTTLTESLQALKITELVIAGAMSHMCIDTTVRAAFDLGYSCKVIADACATRDLEFQGRLIQAQDVHGAIMASLQFAFASVLTTEQFLQHA